MRYLDPKNDLTFKKIFAEHPHLLISFLNSVLPLQADQKIESIEYLPSEMLPRLPLLRFTIVDVLCKDKLGRFFIVEMQMLWTDSFQSRVLFNASKAYVKQLGRGEEFQLLQPVYALSLVNQNYVLDLDRYFHHYKIVAIDEPDLQMKGMEFIFVELQKVKAKSLKEKALGRLWLLFLSESEQLMEQYSNDLQKYPELKEALELLKESSYTKEELETYDKYWDAVRVEKALISDSLRKGREQGIVQGKAEGKVEGREEGKVQTEEKTIIQLQKNGFNTNQISEILELELSFVESVFKKYAVN